jgi:hypothetical protein
MLNIDRKTVAAFLRAFDSITTTQRPTKEEDRIIVTGILDVMKDWLKGVEPLK